MFHAVLADAADDFVGRAHRQTTRYELVYRSIDHRHLRNLCDEIKKPVPAAKYAKYVPVGGFGPDLMAFAAAIVDLQEKRHSADYDPQYRVRMSDAVLAIATSRAALTRFRSAPRTRKKAFLSLAVFSPR